MAHLTRTPFITTGSLLAMLAAAGCGNRTAGGVGNMGGAAADENTGEVVVELTQAPANNTCLVLNYSNGLAPSYNLFAVAGSSTASVVLSLPNGPITITPKAYTTATCTSAGVVSLTPSYNGPSVTVTVNPGVPTQVQLTLHPYLVTASVDFSPAVTSIAVGEATTYAMMSDGTIRAWGFNGQGQLGKGSSDTNANPTPSPVTMGSLSATALASGSLAYHMCAINKADGYAYCWGSNSNGQLGNNTTTNLLVPTVVNGSQPYSTITVGGNNTWATNRTTGIVWVWGANANGQLGNGTTTQLLVPTSQGGVFDLLAGSTARVVARNARAVVGAGSNSYGQLGTGNTTDSNNLSTTTLFANGLWPFALAAGFAHTCAVVGPNGAVQCAGSNSNGQLGDGTTTNRSTPVTVSGLTGAVALSAGYAHSCALKNDSTVWCWGDNLMGQLGDGTSTPRYTPVQVVGITDAKTVAVSDGYSCALRSDATVWCWGTNAQGQLGDGTTVSRSLPTKVLITQ